MRHPRHAAAFVAAPVALLLGLVAGCQGTPQGTTPSTSAASTAATTASASAVAAAPALADLSAYDYAGSLAPIDALDAAVAAAEKDAGKVAALNARLLEILAQPSTTFAARQAICQRLGYLLGGPGGAPLAASDPAFVVLKPWLEDAKLVSIALLTLERVPGAAVDQTLQAAAKRAGGPTRDAILASLRRRQAPTAPAQEPAPSLATLVDQLGGSVMLRKEQALQQLAALPAAQASGAVAAKLAAWDAETQASALVLLGRLGHASAVPAALQATRHAEASVRLVAIDTVGRLPGSTISAQRLLEIAGGTSIDETKAALAALARLNGKDVGAFLLAGAREGEPAARALCLRALASRNATEAIPLVYQLRKDAPVPVRAAALDLLNDIAPFSEQAAVMEWTFQATDTQEIGRAQRALVTITQRAPNSADGIRSLLAALETASVAVKSRHVRLLTRLGDADSLACAARLAQDANAEVAAAALATLARWPDAKALDPLARVATSTTDARQRATAAKAVVDFVEQKRGFLPADQAAAVARVLGVVDDASLRTSLVAALARASDQASAKAAEKLGAEGAAALENIRANLKWPPALSASGDKGSLRNAIDRSATSRWSVSSKEGEWLQIDFKAVRPVRRIVLFQTGRVNDYPAAYEVRLGNDEASLGQPAAKGQGSREQTIVELPEGTRCRVVRIQITSGKGSNNWSVCDLQVE